MLSNSPSVAILLCTYNGERHLSEQLKSIRSQDFQNTLIWVSDDGSTDATLDILQDFQKKWPKKHFSIVKGPCLGFAENFKSLLINKKVKADYYMFADQDDIWQSDKISTALKKIETLGAGQPNLYGSATKLVDEDGKVFGHSNIFKKQPCFANALVQSIAGGNTMMFNDQAKDLLLKVSADAKFISHDWWAYIVITAVGGQVFYDKNSYIKYRQHSGNLIGSNQSVSGRWHRLSMIYKGRFKQWLVAHLTVLNAHSCLLSQPNQKVLYYFNKACSDISPIKKCYYYFRSGVFRQSWIDHLIIGMMFLLNKI